MFTASDAGLRRPERATINVDYTHVGRRASGIERITSEQFNDAVLSPLTIAPFRSSETRLGMMFAQMVSLPWHAVRKRSELFIFPGFPPSPYFALQRDRSILYVHDVFLLTRRADLNRAAKYYMAPQFYIALRKFRYFLTNSDDTAKKVTGYCSSDATVIPYRPFIRNVFGLELGDRVGRPNDPATLKIVAIGTIEPRKNFAAAVEIRRALSQCLNREVELHIIGRAGWGVDISTLSNQHNVILHGYLDDTEARAVIAASDMLLCTSHEEGLCLP